MRNSVIALCLGAMLLGAGSLSFAGQPHGLEKKGKIPHGFTQGKKAGWQNQYPPGWDQKSKKEKKKWKDAVHKGRENVLKAAKKKGMTKQEMEAAADDFEKAARKGLDPGESESLVKDKIKKWKKGKEL